MSDPIKRFKKQKPMTVYIPRPSNRKYPDSVTITNEARTFWEKNIFNSSNLTLVREASTSKISGNINKMTERDIVISQIISDNIGDKVKVMKYVEIVKKDEERLKELTMKEINKYIKNRFARNIYYAQHPKKTKHATIENSTMETATSIDIGRENEININEASNQSQISNVSKKKEYSEIEKLKSLPSMETLLGGKQNLCKEQWNDYSMIHSMFEPFDLVLYNGSHKIPNGVLTHYHTRIVLRFPSTVNLFILFHGNLVHSGAKGYFETSLKRNNDNYSMHYCVSMRAFAYLSKDGNCSRNERKNKNYKPVNNHTETNSIKKSEYKGCICMIDDGGKVDVNKTTVKSPHITEDMLTCDECKEYINKNRFIKDDNGIEICLDKAYMEKMVNLKKKARKTYLEPIIGDIEEHGWAVYEGIPAKNIKKCGKLFNDCRDLIYNNYRKIPWKQLQNKPVAGSGRYGFKISEGYFNIKYGKEDRLASIIEFFKKIEEDCIKKIHGFDKAKFSEGHLLRNVGPLNEQPPHRDYE